MHFLDLPVLSRHPPYAELRRVLVDELGAGSSVHNFEEHARLDAGTRQWLARVSVAELAWIAAEDEDAAETVRSLAARRLATECGVTAPSARTRLVELGAGVSVRLYEPGMTEDHLGRMTWGSSLVLSRRLARSPALVADQTVFELGAGTGLCGITAAMLGARHVDLTDLPEIVPNLERNICENGVSGVCEAFVYDWAAPTPRAGVAVAIVSDPVYSRDHPPMLLAAVAQVAAPVVLLQLPLRQGFEPERQAIYDGLAAQGYARQEYAEEPGRDLFGEQTFAFSLYTSTPAI